MKRTILITIVILAACVGGIIGAFISIHWLNIGASSYSSIEARQQSVLTSYTPDTSMRVPRELDFLATSKGVIPGVVHIRTSYGPGDFSLNPLESFFEVPSRSSGSGVIISDDGYIVTNNHVIEEASNK
jgi:S1-C subfamily serine protease